MVFRGSWFLGCISGAVAAVVTRYGGLRLSSLIAAAFAPVFSIFILTDTPLDSVDLTKNLFAAFPSLLAVSNYSTVLTCGRSLRTGPRWGYVTGS